MNVSVDLSGGSMVGMARDAFTTLHAALFRDGGGHAPGWLQEAGYAGGPALFDSFGRWCAARGLPAPESLGVAEFGTRAAEFLSELGWGRVDVDAVHQSALAIDSADWMEANPASGMQYPGCYFSAGMLADFFGRIAGAQLVAMEVECRSVGHERCRFLLASAETIQHVYEGLTQGVSYEQSLAQMA
jgi:predicted hydrocarbon binding protein